MKANEVNLNSKNNCFRNPHQLEIALKSKRRKKPEIPFSFFLEAALNRKEKGK